MTASSFWGQNPVTITVSAIPMPTSSGFSVANATDLMVGQYIQVLVSGNYERTQIIAKTGNALTVSPALSAAPTAPGSIRNSRDLITNSKLNAGSIFNAANAAELKAVDVSTGPAGLKYLVSDTGRMYRWSPGSTETEDNYRVFADNNNIGRWLLIADAHLAQVISSDQAGNGSSYITDSSSRVVVTLPVNTGLGSPLQIINRGSGGWELLLNPGQIIRDKNAIYFYGYHLRSVDPYTSIQMICTALGEYTMVFSYGSFTAGALGAGFIGGGAGADLSRQTIIEKLSYSTETCLVLGATLDHAVSFQPGGGVGISSQTKGKGYFLGCHDSSNSQNYIEDMHFTNETSSLLSATIGIARYGLGTAASTSNGYHCGGWTNSARSVTIGALVFSTETSGTVADTLDTARALMSSCQSDSTAYWYGGNTSAEVFSDDIEKFVFSTETSNGLIATLPGGRYSMVGVCASTAGYGMGGFSNGNVQMKTLFKLAYSTETANTLAATLDKVKDGAAGIYSLVKGYTAGGVGPSSAGTAVIEELNFVSETSMVLLATLSGVKYYPQGVSYLG